MGLCFAFVSGKGGTGKSTVSCGLAMQFSQLGKKVLIIDLDEGLRCLDMLFGIEKDVVFDLSDVLNGEKELEDAIYKAPFSDNISIVPAPQTAGNIKPEPLCGLINAQLSNYDVIILDMPAGVDFSCLSNVSRQLYFVTVCNADPVSVRDAAAVASVLPDCDNETRLIINRFEPSLIKAGLYDNIDEIIDKSGLRLIGIVPQSFELNLLPVKHMLGKKGRASKALGRIALRLLGADVRLPNPKKI